MTSNRDDMTVRVTVRASFALSLTITEPISKQGLAENIAAQVEAAGFEDFIDGWSIDSIHADDDRTLLVASHEK